MAFLLSLKQAEHLSLHIIAHDNSVPCPFTQNHRLLKKFSKVTKWENTRLRIDTSVEDEQRLCGWQIVEK